jgi:hypothetical protein
MASTEAIGPDSLPPAVRTAIERSAELHGIEGLLAAPLAVCRSTSEAQKRRFGRGGESAIDYLILTPEFLICIRAGDEPAATIWTRAGAELRYVSESIGGTSISGLAITAFRPGAAERESGFLPLASDEPGRSFAERALAPPS